MIILNDWTDLIGMKLNYQDYDNSILDFNILKNEILNDNNNSNDNDNDNNNDNDNDNDNDNQPKA
jgi:hypothetical protein